MVIDERINKILGAEGRMRSMLDEMQRFRDASGGGGSGHLEDRLNRLEGRLDKVGDELSEVKVQIATLSERMSHLPGKGFIVKTTMAALALFAGLAVFADNIKALLG